MRFNLVTSAGIIAVSLSTAAVAQTQPAAEEAVPPQSSQSQTTTSPTPNEPGSPGSPAPGQTGTTPGQSQTTPGEASELPPATTGQTPSAQATGQAEAQVTPATAADVKAGTSVYDQKGQLVGKIESVKGKTAVVTTGKARASIEISSFAKGEKGLVIGMTKAEVQSAAKKKSGK